MAFKSPDPALGGMHLCESLLAEHLLGLWRDKHCMLPMCVGDLLTVGDIENGEPSGTQRQDHKPPSPRCWISLRFEVDICAPALSRSWIHNEVLL